MTEHEEGPMHLVHMANECAAEAVEQIELGLHPAFAVGGAYMFGAEIGLRCARARPDLVDEYIRWIEEQLGEDDPTFIPETREAAFVAECHLLFEGRDRA